MKIISNLTVGPGLQKVVVGLVLGIVLMTAAAVPVHADDHDRGRQAAGDRDWRAHEGRRGGYEPGVVYAPPVVYSPPQYEEPGFNLVVPLNFR